MICIHCGNPATSLYQQYAVNAIRLRTCKQCGEFVDPLAEEDGFNVLLDLLLHKKEAFRHVIFNRLEYHEFRLHSGLSKLGIVIILVECYIKWFLFQSDASRLAVKPEINAQRLLSANIAFPSSIVLVSVLGAFGYVAGAALGLWIWMRYLERRRGVRSVFFQWNFFLATLILGGYGKLGFFLMTVWDYELHLRIPISVFVTTSSVVALQAFYGGDRRDDLKAAVLTVSLGMITRNLIQLVCAALGVSQLVTFLL